MKFAFVITNLCGGGAEKAILKTAHALLVRGHDVWIITLESRVDYDLPAGIHWHSIVQAGKQMGKGWLGKRKLAWQLRQYMARLVPDVVVSTLPFADEVAHLAKLRNHWCRIANTLSEEIALLEKSNPAKAQRRRKRYQSIYNQHGLIAVSEGVATDLRQHVSCASPIVGIPNPFEFEYIRQLAESPINASAEQFAVHVGRFAPQKRHDLLLDAWQRLNVPHKLLLLTEPHPQLDVMIRERSLQQRVEVVGFQKNPYPWMRQAELLVLCSDHEGLPNVLIESLICGTPVVSTDCPSGPRQILGAALPECIVPVGNVDALAQAIATCLRETPDITQVDLQRYGSEAVAEAYERLAQKRGGC